MTALPLILTVFVACAVEAIEALTIVLAAGLTREWRSTFQGMAAALLVLAAIVGGARADHHAAAADRAAAGRRRPAGHLRAAVAAQGHPARRPGTRRCTTRPAPTCARWPPRRPRPTSSRRGVNDWYAFTLSFKGVLLEGLEVVFIVITFGANQRNLGAAVIGAALAVVVVTVTGIAVRAPLAKVPENAMKFVVGSCSPRSVLLGRRGGRGAPGPAATRRCWCWSGGGRGVARLRRLAAPRAPASEAAARSPDGSSETEGVTS